MTDRNARMRTDGCTRVACRRNGAAPHRMLGVVAGVLLTGLCLAGLTASAFAQQDGVVARYLGTKEPSAPPASYAERRGDARPLAITATPPAPAISFNEAAVGIAAASAQTHTASFAVSGYTGSFTPTASLHYGLSYTAGTVSCSDTGQGTETCTIPITFLPAYPGGRRDALFLMDGATRLATVLLYGVGRGPLALVQPGFVTNTVNSTGNGSNSYFYQSVTDENGTVWSISDNVYTLTSVTKEGVISIIPVTGLSGPQAIGIDGAGVLYIAPYTTGSELITYDTVQGTQGTFTLPARELFGTVGVGNTGNIYAVDDNNNVLYIIAPDGTSSMVTLTSNGSGQTDTPLSIAVDSDENLFFGGYFTINEYSAAGVQGQINPNSVKYGIAVDPAETVYASRYGDGGLPELVAADYATPLYDLPITFPFGISLGPDGTANVGNYYSLLEYIRSEGALTFSGDVGVTSTAQNAGIYNGGNESLTISKISLTGSAFALASVAGDECTGAVALAPGHGCQVAVTYTAPNAGSFTGALTFSTNSRNAVDAPLTVTLSGTTAGVYIVAAPAAVKFPYQAVNTTSAPMMVTISNNGFSTGADITTPTTSEPAFNPTLGTCTSALAPGTSCQLSVTFSPSMAKAYSGTVTVPTLQGQAASFTVSGSAASGPIMLSVNEVLHLSDGTPKAKPSTELAITEVLHLSDGTPKAIPSTELVINEVLHLADEMPARKHVVVRVPQAADEAPAPPNER